MLRKTIVAICGLALLFAAAAGGLGYLGKSTARASAYIYETAPVTKGEIRRVVTTTGIVRPRMTVQVGSEISGRIQSITADFNARVKSGDLLAVINPKTFESKARQAKADVDVTLAAVSNAEAAVRRARSVLANANKGLDRQTLLGQKGIGAGAALDTAAKDVQVATADVESAQATLDSSKAAVAQKQAQYEQAMIDLERTRIRAPISGIVLHRAVDVGQTVAASFQAPELFIIAEDLKSIHLEAQVGESDIGSVKLGQATTFDVDAYPKRRFQGRVSQIRLSPASTDSVVTYTVIVEAENAGLALYPGMTANVRIETARLENVVRLPADAVRFKPPKTARSGDGAGMGSASSVVGTLERWKDRFMVSLKLQPEPATMANDAIAIASEPKDAKAGAVERWSRRLKLTPEQVTALRQALTSPDGKHRKLSDGAIEPVLESLLTAEQKTRLAKIRADRDSTSRATVWALTGEGQLEKRSVRIGMSDLQNVELASNELRPGDQIVVRSRKVKSQ